MKVAQLNSRDIIVDDLESEKEKENLRVKADELRKKVESLTNELEKSMAREAAALEDMRTGYIKHDQAEEEINQGYKLSKVVKTKKLDALKVKQKVQLSAYLQGLSGERTHYFYSDGSFIYDLFPFGKTIYDATTGKTFHEGNPSSGTLMEINKIHKDSSKLVKVSSVKCGAPINKGECEVWRRTLDSTKGLTTEIFHNIKYVDEATLIPWKALIPSDGFNPSIIKKSIAKVLSNKRIINKGMKINGKFIENGFTTVDLQLISTEYLRQQDFPNQNYLSSLVSESCTLLPVDGCIKGGIDPDLNLKF